MSTSYSHKIFVFSSFFSSLNRKYTFPKMSQLCGREKALILRLSCISKCMFRRGHSRNLVLTSRQSHPWFCVSVLFQGTTGNILNTSHPQSAPPVIWLCLHLMVAHILLPRLLFLWAWDVFKVTKRAYSNIACFSRAKRRQDSLVYDFFIHPVCFFVVSFTLYWHEQEIP